MTLTRSLALGLALGVLLASHPATAMDPDELARWEQTLSELQNDLVEARARVREATIAYQEARVRKYPRGERRAELIAQLEAAKKRLAEAELALPEMLEKARRAGVPPVVLSRFENPAVAASEAD